MNRKCVGCGQLIPRENLIKITKNYENDEVIINPNSKTFGRSAYLCYNQSCIDTAFKKSKLNKALKCVINIEKSQLYDLLDNRKEH